MKWCDFHIHTNYSDGELSLREVIDLYGKGGFGAIAITDHLCDSKSLLGLSAKYLFDEVLSSGLPMIANSDFHKTKHFSSWKTLLQSTDSFAEVKQQILSVSLKFKFFHSPGGESCLDPVYKMPKAATTASEGPWFVFD